MYGDTVYTVISFCGITMTLKALQGIEKKIIGIHVNAY